MGSIGPAEHICVVVAIFLGGEPPCLSQIGDNKACGLPSQTGSAMAGLRTESVDDGLELAPQGRPGVEVVRKNNG